MKKIIGILLCFFGILCIKETFYAQASTEDYLTFSEIMMNQGKLMKDFTTEETASMLKNVQKNKFADVVVYEENKEIDASYISNTLYSVENKGSTDVTYDVVVDVETSNKVSFSASGSLSGSASSGKTGGVKKDIGAKCGLEVTTTSTSSRKEKQTMKLVVEGGSRAIVYLTGNLTVTNGVAAKYICWVKVSEGAFEIVTLKNQYARIEKAKI